MKNINEYRKIYNGILTALEDKSLSRRELIDEVILNYGLTEDELGDDSTNGKAGIIRSMTGVTINHMLSKAVIRKDQSGMYYKNSDKPVALRIERCEEEILHLLYEGGKTKSQIKDALADIFKTNETPSIRDDNTLFTFIGQILKRLTEEKLIQFDGSVYSILPKRAAEIKSREEIQSLKADFLTMIHSKGGEFFEHYFMNLLAKYLVRCGKIVTESRRVGGSDDGGIDGIAKTVDSLGFRETIMVQTKNRIDLSTETEIRGFYGAVCAAQGSRGIFATTSDFHPTAKKFLDSIDNCVGVNGDKLFSMATDASYGIKREGKKLVIDLDIF